MRTLGTMITGYRCQLYMHFVLISCHYCRGRSYCWQVYCSRKFMRVQICVQTLQKKFSWFLLLRNECRMLWPCPYQLMPTPHMWTEETKLNDERSKLAQQQPSLPFVWRPSHLQRYQDYRCGCGEKLQRCGLRDYVPTHIHLIVNNWCKTIKLAWICMYYAADFGGSCNGLLCI